MLAYSYGANYPMWKNSYEQEKHSPAFMEITDFSSVSCIGEHKGLLFMGKNQILPDP